MTHLSNDIGGGIGISSIGSPIGGEGSLADAPPLNSIPIENPEVAEEISLEIASARSLPLSNNA